MLQAGVFFKRVIKLGLLLSLSVATASESQPHSPPVSPNAVPPPPGAYNKPLPWGGTIDPSPGPGHDGVGNNALLPEVPTPFAGVTFTDSQRQQISQLLAQEQEVHQQRVDLMQQAWSRLDELYRADLWDTAAITRAYDEVYSQQRLTIEAMARVRNRIYGMMSNAQREQLRQSRQQASTLTPSPPQ